MVGNLRRARVGADCAACPRTGRRRPSAWLFYACSRHAHPRPTRRGMDFRGLRRTGGFSARRHHRWHPGPGPHPDWPRQNPRRRKRRPGLAGDRCWIGGACPAPERLVYRACIPLRRVDIRDVPAYSDARVRPSCSPRHVRRARVALDRARWRGGGDSPWPAARACDAAGRYHRDSYRFRVAGQPVLPGQRGPVRTGVLRGDRVGISHSDDRRRDRHVCI